jgi:hypothetical protein
MPNHFAFRTTEISEDKVWLLKEIIHGRLRQRWFPNSQTRLLDAKSNTVLEDDG